VSRSVETFHVLLKPEDRRSSGGLIAAYPLEDSQAVMKGMGEYVNLGLGPVYKLSIHPYF
jgi:hypothetical protein